MKYTLFYSRKLKSMQHRLIIFKFKLWINTRLFIWCLKNLDPKSKTAETIPVCHILLQDALFNCLSIECPISRCIWFYNATSDLYCKTVMQHTLHLPNSLALKSSSVINLVYSDKQPKNDGNCSVLFL